MSLASRESLIRLTHQAQAATWPFTALSTILYGIRCYSRVYISHSGFVAEDVVMALSWVLNVTRATFFQVSLAASRQVTLEDLAHTMPKAAWWIILTDSWAYVSISVPKVGICLMMIRIFKPRRLVVTLMYMTCLMLLVGGLAGIFLGFFQCDPPAGQWDPSSHPHTRCWSRKVQVVYANCASAFSAATDFTFAIYSGTVVWSLQMPVWKKVSTSTLMGLGVAAGTVAVVKILVSNLQTPFPLDVYQLIIDAIRIGIWNAIENDLVLCAAYLPSSPPFFKACKRYSESIWSSFSLQKLISTSSGPQGPSGTSHKGDLRAPEIHTHELTSSQDSEASSGRPSKPPNPTIKIKNWFDTRPSQISQSEYVAESSV